MTTLTELSSRPTAPDFRRDAFQPSPNPSRRKASPHVRQLAVEAVVSLLEAGMSFTAAVSEIGLHCGWAANSVRRWCYAAGVTSRASHGADAAHARQMAALAEFNRRLVGELQQRGS